MNENEKLHNAASTARSAASTARSWIDQIHMYRFLANIGDDTDKAARLAEELVAVLDRIKAKTAEAEYLAFAA